MAPEQLIEALAADLRPVRQLPQPVLRTLHWVAIVVAAGVLSLSFADVGAVRARMAMAPDLVLATAGAAATAVLAALAAFQLSVPGRSRGWAWVPVPAMLVWLSGSGWGCLRGFTLPGLPRSTMHDAMHCVVFITMVSVPLSALLIVMLRRAFPLWPRRIGAMGGLAAAAAAACLLTLFHPYDVSVVDLAMHGVAVGVVVGAARWVGA